MKFLLIFSFIPLTILSQEKTIRGRIVGKNGQGVSFYQVGLYNSDTSFVKVILTDSLGSFNFKKLSSNTIYLLNVNQDKKAYFPFSITSLEDDKTLPPFSVDKNDIQLYSKGKGLRIGQAKIES